MTKGVKPTVHYGTEWNDMKETLSNSEDPIECYLGRVMLRVDDVILDAFKEVIDHISKNIEDGEQAHVIKLVIESFIVTMTMNIMATNGCNEDFIKNVMSSLSESLKDVSDKTFDIIKPEGTKH